eukprot:2706411-Rhodomonas_salina.1
MWPFSSSFPRSSSLLFSIPHTTNISLLSFPELFVTVLKRRTNKTALEPKEANYPGRTCRSRAVLESWHVIHWGTDYTTLRCPQAGH